ncbi:MAG: hypothetical protein B6D63_05540 [Candidatus Latescibacteria bacterium 4484_7]|nr:MAG: hypothetical protein B6D63_05540 [Candidatus Latescibacteria bacterium 4484_7]
MKEILRLTLILTAIAAISAGVLAFVSSKTENPIKQALRAEKMVAVSNVLPSFDNEPDKDTLSVVTEDGERELFYIGKKNGKVVGAAFEVIAPDGYSGPIDIMVGVDTAGVVTGVEILKYLETPGLGAKVATKEFRGQFKGKSIKNPDDWHVMKDGGIFRQITGATISSRAVTKAIARGLEFFDKHRAVVIGEGKIGSSGKGG